MYMKSVTEHKAHIQHLVSQSDLEGAFNLLDELVNLVGSAQVKNEFILLKVRFNEIKSSLIRGTGSNTEEKNALTNAVLLFTDKVAILAEKELKSSLSSEQSDGQDSDAGSKQKDSPITNAPPTPPSSKKRLYWGLGIASLFILAAVWIGSIIAGRPTPVKNPQLCAIQQEMRTPYSTQVDTNGISFEDLYIQANPDLGSQVRELSNQRNTSHFGVTLISAIAGYGKTFILRSILKGALQSEYHEVLLDEFASSHTNLAKQVPDLEFLKDGGKIVLSTIPEIRSDSMEDLINTWLEKEKFLIIDAFDEIHQSSCNQILEILNKKVSGAPRGDFHHVFILGRPESFKDYLSRSTYPGDLKIYPLQSLDIRDYGTMALRVDNYIGYKPPMGDIDTSVYTDNVFKLIQRFPDLTYSFPNLGLSTVIIEKANGIDVSKITSNELRETMIEHMYNRAREKHHRPHDGLQYWELYERALVELAVQYSEVNSDGSFEVNEADQIEFKFEGHSYKVNAKSLLDRSGLIDLRPAQQDISYYSFFPFWVHEYLIEQYNLAQNPKYEIAICP